MRSGRKRKRPEQNDPVFFFDRNVSSQMIAQPIRDRGLHVLLMADVYPNDATQAIEDDEWIALADSEGWVAITKDLAIRRDHSEALENSTLRVFAFNNANITGEELARRLDTNLNRILQRAAKPGPYVYVIGSNKLQLAWPKEQPT